jgi:hypothetical protein
MFRLAMKLVDNNRNVNNFVKILVSHEGYHKKIVLLFYLILMVVPNIKYYMVSNLYMVQYFIYLPLLYVSLLFISVFYELSK